MLSRLIALSTTALVALAASPSLADCVDDGAGAILCSGASTAQLSDPTDGLDVTVAAGASVSSATQDAVVLNGDDVSLTNDGSISASASNREAVKSSGANFTLTNDGEISAGDNGVQLTGPGARITNAGGISSVDGDAIDANGGDVEIDNSGTIESIDGRGIQVRGVGATIVNSGVIETGGETIEGRADVALTNLGIISNIGGEDAVQFADGVIDNAGVISGGDDGVDIDEGLIVNDGVITSTSKAEDSAGVDVDPILEREDGSPVVPAGLLQIENYGEISGYHGILYDSASTADAAIRNEGLIEGFGAAALQFAPGQGLIDLTLAGASEVVGAVNFGGSDDTLFLDALTRTGDILGGGVADGGDGLDSLLWADMDLIAVALLDMDLYRASFANALGGESFIRFRNFEFVDDGFGGNALPPAPVPLPAALPMLALGLGGLLAFRRRA